MMGSYADYNAFIINQDTIKASLDKAAEVMSYMWYNYTWQYN